MQVASGIGGDINKDGRKPFAIDGIPGKLAEFYFEDGKDMTNGFIFLFVANNITVNLRFEAAGLTENDVCDRTFVESIFLK